MSRHPCLRPLCPCESNYGPPRLVATVHDGQRVVEERWICTDGHANLRLLAAGTEESKGAQEELGRWSAKVGPGEAWRA